MIQNNLGDAFQCQSNLNRSRKVGRRTGAKVIPEGKVIRKDENGFEDFNDYWTTSESESDEAPIDFDKCRRIGRRTKVDVIPPGKTVRIKEDGIEDFRDYWTDESTVSIRNSPLVIKRKSSLQIQNSSPSILKSRTSIRKPKKSVSFHNVTPPVDEEEPLGHDAIKDSSVPANTSMSQCEDWRDSGPSISKRRELSVSAISNPRKSNRRDTYTAAERQSSENNIHLSRSMTANTRYEDLSDNADGIPRKSKKNNTYTASESQSSEYNVLSSRSLTANNQDLLDNADSNPRKSKGRDTYSASERQSSRFTRDSSRSVPLNDHDQDLSENEDGYPRRSMTAHIQDPASPEFVDGALSKSKKRDTCTASDRQSSRFSRDSVPSNNEDNDLSGNAISNPR